MFPTRKLAQGYTNMPKISDRNDSNPLNLNLGGSSLDVKTMVTVWEARDIQDCQKDLKNLADGMKQELKQRFETGFISLYVIV